MNKSLLIIGLVISIVANAQTTSIPDANFEQALINGGIDTDGIVNGQMTTADALGVTTLLVGSQNISDLTGIEAFTSLTTLDATQNQLTTLDLSALTTLQLITVWGNNLTNIDLSTNPSLGVLYVNDNQLTSLDVSNNLLINEFFCENNFITQLDLSNHLALADLFCENNSLTCLNVKNGNNSNFTTFNITGNAGLTCIDVDDIAWSNANWTVVGGNIGSGMTFSTNCGNSCIVGVVEYTLSSVSIFPNPSSSVITISGDSKLSSLMIINSVGETVANVALDSEPVDISELKNGIYFLLFMGIEGELFTQKFIKQ
jgi:hypothetical protein